MEMSGNFHTYHLHLLSGGACTVSTEFIILYTITYNRRFCAGQSNMELGMSHALSRNRTFKAVDERGMYSNVRIYQHGKLKALDGNEQFVTPPPVPVPPPKDGTAPKSYTGWQRPNSSKIRPFSAACWFFGQELTDIAMEKNETPPILGLIQSAWGLCLWQSSHV